MIFLKKGIAFQNAFMASVERLKKKGHASDWVQNKAVHELYNQLKDKLDDNVRIKGTSL